MVQLWNAVIFLARNESVQDECRAVAEVQDVDTLPEDRRAQPTAAAIRNLNEILNKNHGLRLGLYQLSEINRWLLLDGFQTKLRDYWTAIQQSGTGSPAFHEAAGVVLLDNLLRSMVAGDADPMTLLNEKGFAITQDEAQHLRARLASGEAAATAAQEVVDLLWVGSSCGSRLESYSKYVHPNY